jgi:hypothetical protein
MNSASDDVFNIDIVVNLLYYSLNRITRLQQRDSFFLFNKKEVDKEKKRRQLLGFIKKQGLVAGVC